MTTTLFGIAAVPTIVGLVQVAKELGTPPRFAPLLAVLFGILAALSVPLAQNAAAAVWVQAIFTGIALGLSAAGLYSGVAALVPGSGDASASPGVAAPSAEQADVKPAISHPNAFTTSMKNKPEAGEGKGQ